jgi:hypothetical protein
MPSAPCNVLASWLCRICRQKSWNEWEQAFLDLVLCPRSASLHPSFIPIKRTCTDFGVHSAPIAITPIHSLCNASFKVVKLQKFTKKTEDSKVQSFEHSKCWSFKYHKNSELSKILESWTFFKIERPQQSKTLKILSWSVNFQAPQACSFIERWLTTCFGYVRVDKEIYN